MVVVYASKGPLAGRQVDIPDDQVDAATGESGWAIKIEPGAQLLADPGAVYDESWVIPGYSTEDLKPFTKKEDGAKETEAKPTSTKAAPASTPPKESSSKTSAAGTASGSSADNGDDAAASKTKASPK